MQFSAAIKTDETDFDELEIKKEFFAVLQQKQITTLFQPIISLRDGVIIGYEALSRGPENSRFFKPNVLIEYARKYHALLDLEYLFRYSALHAAMQLPKDLKLFLNVDPNIIQEEHFSTGFTKTYLKQFLIDPERIVFEITERESVRNLANFKTILEHYRAQNYQVGIDDAGAGYSGLNLISDIRPHYIKLDMHLVRNIDNDLIKQALVKGMCEFASLTNTLIIAEGIETQEELSKLIEFDIAYGQGFFIQHPSSAVHPVGKDVLDLIHSRNKIKNRFFGTRVNDFYIKNISRPSAVVSPDVTTSHLRDILESEPALPGVCVVKNNRPIGVITRQHFYRQLSGQFGYSLFAEKPVHNIMSEDFLAVDYKTTIDVVSKRAMSRPPKETYDFIVATEENMYYGIITVKDLLEKVIEIEVANAKNLNPLSELPGNIVIEMQLERLISLMQSKYVLYFDVDNFKAYNDYYGFEHGDCVLKRLTRILKNHMPQNAFLGHIGGDDFIAILDASDVDAVCAGVIKEFDQAVPSFYNNEDLDRGYLTVKNRKLIEENFPLMSLSVVGINSCHCKNIYILGERAGKLKKRCKQLVGSNYMIEDVQA